MCRIPPPPPPPRLGLARLSTLVRSEKVVGVPPPPPLPPLFSFFGTCATFEAGGAPVREKSVVPPPPPLFENPGSAPDFLYRQLVNLPEILMGNIIPVFQGLASCLMCYLVQENGTCGWMTHCILGKSPGLLEHL